VSGFFVEDRAVKTYAAAFALMGALGLAGSGAEAQSLSSATLAKNLTVAVEIDGSVPGFTADQLESYVAQQMAATHVTAWHFEPGPAPGGPITSQPANRIVWHFNPLPYAGGGIRYIGPAVSRARQLFGVGRAVGVDAKIFLNGKFEATTFDQVTVKDGAKDAGLSAVIQKVMKSVVANAMVEGKAEGPKLA
jgi:hypothetical protein